MQVLPLEQTGPELAASLLAIVEGRHNVKSFSFYNSGSVFTLQDGSQKIKTRDKYQVCLCGSGKKRKFCCN